jgi:hypothetical protein
MIEWVLLAWVVVNGQLMYDQAQVTTIRSCAELGQKYVDQGKLGEFICIFQQDL